MIIHYAAVQLAQPHDTMVAHCRTIPAAIAANRLATTADSALEHMTHRAAADLALEHSTHSAEVDSAVKCAFLSGMC